MNKLTLLTVIMLILASGAVLTQFMTTDEEYSRYNIGWNGTTDFFLMAEGKELLYAPEDLSGKTNSTLLIIAPKEEDFPRLSGYLNAGNTVLIADQSGNANILLENLGSSIRVHNDSVRSTSMEYRDPGLFRGTVLGNIYNTSVTELTFNYPGYVSGGEPLVTTSYLSWIDTNLNGIPDANESLKVYTLIATENISSGRLAVIADPSLFINSMLVRKHTENLAVLSALLENDIIIDQTISLTTGGGGLTGLLQQMHRYPVLGTAILTILCIVAGGIGIRRFYHDR